MFSRCLLNVTDRSRRAQTFPLVFVPKVYSPSQSDTVNLFIKDTKCESMMNELAIRPSQYFALTLVCREMFSLTVLNNVGEALMACENYASYVLWKSNCHIEQEPDLASGMASGFGFILARIQVWRMESYAWKFADDVLLGIFVTGSACSLIPATAQIQAWGKPVRTSVDDVLLLALVLKHVVPSLIA
uniref:Uncharacterized protein n=1 Tax=Tanacetum cinerariifolium TaxID=118510 RepID=A0A699L5M6_TANCI|nr:hypothetical protein [Tanacetum cinerariifolium]